MNIKEIKNKIDSFKNLPDGWNYGKGGPPSPSILSRAFNVIEFLDSLNVKDMGAFVGNDEIMITAYFKYNYLEITCESDDTYVFCWENKSLADSLYIDQISEKACKQLVEIFLERYRNA